MKRSRKRTFRRNAAAKSLASARFRQRIVRNRKTYTRKGRRPTDSGLSGFGTLVDAAKQPRGYVTRTGSRRRRAR